MTHIHHVPGRLRVRVPQIKKSQQKAAVVRSILHEMHGISSAAPNLVTVSIVIHYDPDSTNAESILILLRERGYVLADLPRPAPLSAPNRIPKKIATAVFWYCVETAVERSIPLLIAAIL